MLTVVQTPTFQSWLDDLKDLKARIRIVARIRRLETGHFGDCAVVGDGVSELRVHVGPGYRLYFARRGNTVVILLIGGDKSTQSRDIRRALQLALEIGEL